MGSPSGGPYIHDKTGFFGIDEEIFEGTANGLCYQGFDGVRRRGLS